jgi:hypothetical protein
MPNVHILPAGSLNSVSSKITALHLEDDDLVLTHPLRGARVVGTVEEIEAAHELFGSAVAVAAGSEPPAEGEPAEAWLKALSRDSGELPYRPYLYPALCGRVGAVTTLLADCAGREGTDTQRLAEAMLSGAHDVALDAGGQLFRVLDGTGTDVVAVAGKLHAGPERPVALLDPTGGERLEPVAAALAAEGSRDLAAILRYSGAIPCGGPTRVPAPEILVVPFWRDEFCEILIRAAEATGLWSSDPDDPVPGAEVSLFTVSPRLVALIEEDLEARFWPEVKQHWGEVAVTGLHDAFVIRYEPGGATAGLGLHHDVAQISAHVKLNQGYEGGALSFPRQQWDTSEVNTGELVVWPSLVTHPHRSEPVTRGVKYGLTLWFRLPGE